MPKIHVIDRDGTPRVVEATAGLSLMEPLRDLDAGGVEALCGGMCSCSTCHVFVDPDWYAKLPAPKDDEEELLEGTENFRPRQSRLACQIPVTEDLDGLKITVAPAE